MSEGEYVAVVQPDGFWHVFAKRGGGWDYVFCAWDIRRVILYTDRPITLVGFN